MGDGIFTNPERLCVPNVDDLRHWILCFLYSIYSGSSKMYHDLREVLWWDDLKRHLEEFFRKVTEFLTSKSREPKAGWFTSKKCKFLRGSGQTLIWTLY